MRLNTLLVGFLTLSCASAQNLEEIIVTGELRRTPLDELHGSVTVLDGTAVEARGATHLEDVLPLAANVNFSSGGSRSRFFQIRGIGERGQFAETFNPSVGVLIDGADLSFAATGVTLFDIEQIEIFRGPQGTRYGANALAGLINVTSRGPGDVAAGRVSLSAGEYGERTLAAAYGGPVNDTLGARVAVQHHGSDGFYHNAWLGSDATNRLDELSARARVDWQAAAGLEVSLTAGRIDQDNGYDAFSLDNNRITLSDEPGRDAQDTGYVVLNAVFSGARSFSAIARVATAESDSTYGYDEDWTFTGFHPWGYSSTDYYLRDRRTGTGEFRLQSKAEGRLFGATTDWDIGVYQLSSDEALTREYTWLANPFGSTFHIDRQALFGQLQTRLGSGFEIAAGIRRERHESDYADSDGNRFTPGENLDGWRISVGRVMGAFGRAYVLAAGGYKAGGFNPAGTLEAELRNFDPEKTVNLETGFDALLSEERLGLRVAVFRMRRDAVQIARSLTLTRADGSSEFVEFIDNALAGTNAGIEAEIAWRPDARWQLNAGLGLLRSRYERVLSSEGIDLDGREQAHAPGYQASISVRYALSSRWSLAGSIEARDAFYFSDSHHQRAQAQALGNLTLRLQAGRWDLQLWVRNLFDEDTETRGYYFGNDPRLDYAPRTYVQLGAPRRVGLSIERAL